MDGMKRWMREALGLKQGIPARQGDWEFWEQIQRSRDAYGHLIAVRHNPAHRFQLQIGNNQGFWLQTAPRTHVLALGPSQNRIGKSSSVVIPTILAHGGPVVSTSTKFDVARATALARSRLGRVWYYDPTGEWPAPPGFTELRWSPVAGSGTWNAARKMATQMMAVANLQGQSQGRAPSNNENFWEVTGAGMLAVALRYAAVIDADMSHVVGVIKRFAKDDVVKAVIDGLRDQGEYEAIDTALSHHDFDSRTRTNVIATVLTALRPYEGAGVRVTKDVNFDPSKFVLGKPDIASEVYGKGDFDSAMARAGLRPKLVGKYDTVYIQLAGTDQELYAPAVIALLHAIKDAKFNLRRWEEHHGIDDERQPVLFALDEMYGAPLPDLMRWLADAGGQGVLLCGALQDLSQAEAVWGTAGRGMLTHWQSVIVMPGIRDRQTLELLSMLVGAIDRQVANRSETIVTRGMFTYRDWLWSYQTERVPRLPPDVIYQGNPGNDREALIFLPDGGWGHIELRSYWRDWPWPWLLTQSCHWALTQGRFANRVLPLPPLSRGDDYSALLECGGRDLANAWYEVRLMSAEEQHYAAGTLRVKVDGVPSVEATETVGSGSYSDSQDPSESG